MMLLGESDDETGSFLDPDHMSQCNFERNASTVDMNLVNILTLIKK